MGNIIIIALLAAALYYFFKSYGRYTAVSQEAFKNFSTSHDAIAQSELGLFVALVAKVAKADGRVDALEAQLVSIMFDDISAVFPEPATTKGILKEIFNREKEIVNNVDEVCARFAQLLRRDRAKQQHYMAFLIQLAFVDGEMSKSEEELLSRIAEAIEIDPNIYHAIFDRFEEMIKHMTPKANIADAYKLLGVSENDDMDTIKKAYRALVKQYHPDIIKSQTQDESYLQEATAKTQEINQAYEMIKKARGD